MQWMQCIGYWRYYTCYLRECWWRQSFFVAQKSIYHHLGQTPYEAKYAQARCTPITSCLYWKVRINWLLPQDRLECFIRINIQDMDIGINPGHFGTWPGTKFQQSNFFTDVLIYGPINHKKSRMSKLVKKFPKLTTPFFHHTRLT